MIESKKDYKEYLLADKLALKRTRRFPRINDYVWKYEILLRKCEYYNNCKKSIINRFYLKYLKFRKSRLSMMYGFSIPLNTFGKGLSIAHIGPIIVNEYARIGDYCRIHVGVNIGTNAGIHNQAPTIGDCAYIGPGAKIFGNIRIGNNVAIGANAVVNKDFLEDGITIAGVPAKIVSNKGSKNLL